jgi:hypothetical protein
MIGVADSAMIATLNQIRVDLLGRYGHKLQILYLIGSRARGTHRPDSDWDVVVIRDDQHPMVRGEDGQPVGPVLLQPLHYEDGTKVDIIPLCPRELGLDHWLPRCVRSEGICFYERKDGKAL